MCGIAGMVTYGGAEPFVPAAEQMAAAMSHRGPDSSGIQSLGSCLLVNTRLAIVDLSERGRQPMSNEDGSAWITYNGECYNAEELREAMLALGHRFRSATDTEVVLHAYKEFGEGCVEKLRGMFAFAIWDGPARKLFLARDRLGIKPLYYALLPEGLLFASEIKALLASGLVPRKLDAKGIRAFLQLGHIPPPWTAIRLIQPLEPGHFAVRQDGEFRKVPYWSVHDQVHPRQPTRSEETATQISEVLLEAGRLQLMSDVPIALFLSGGIDSAAIGALMRQAGQGKLTAVTVGFEEEAFDETEPSRRTAEQLRIPHRVLKIPSQHLFASLDHAFWAMDQPTVDGINAYWVCRAAAEAGYKVALSGQGGDELFGGYESLAWFERLNRLATWIQPFPKRALGAVIDQPALPFRWRKLSYLFRVDDPFVAAQLAVKVHFLEQDLRKLLNPGLRNGAFDSMAAEHLASWASQTDEWELREKLAFMDIETHLLPRLLRDGDAMSMAHSLEVRPVFLDHKVVEAALALPASLRMQKKRLLLASTRQLMPNGLYADLVQRPKRTFTFPFAHWLSGGLQPAIQQAFSSERLRAVGVLNPAGVKAVWQRYLRSPASVGWSRIWTLFALQRWCETMQIRA